MNNEVREDLFQPGDLVQARFRIVRLVGKGGMGEVYRAEDLSSGKIVALKMILPELLGSAKTRARFEREVEWTRRIHHPNVIEILEFFHCAPRRGRDDQELIPCVAMEFLDGQSLVDHLNHEGAMNSDSAIEIVCQMASALEAAHQAGIVHRDLKPDNVILVRTGKNQPPRVVLTDFGVARESLNQTMSEESLTESNVIVGTPQYMAPELLELDEAAVTSDVYSLGMLFYEMVTGSMVFADENPLRALFARVNEPAPSPRELIPDLDESCERVITRCLERDPALRYQSAREILDELGGVAAAPTIDPQARRQMMIITGLVVLGLMIVALLVWFYAQPS